MNSVNSNRKRNVTVLAIGAACVVICLLIANYVFNRTTPANVVANNTTIVDSLNTDRLELETQQFQIDTRNDTVVVTKHGTVFAIPAHAFESSSQSVLFTVQEATTPAEIIRAGLSTMADDKLLETGGMFNIQAYAAGKSVNISKEIIAETPSNIDSKNMKLFDGVVQADSSINWTNPQPVEHYLNTYEVTSLDFYPPRYFEGLQKRNLDVTNKTFTDSLYYSLEESNEIIVRSAPVVEVDETYTYGYYETIRENRSDTLRKSTFFHEVQPSQIRAIWNSKFNESLVATKEFEERLKVMHTACNGGVLLNFYLENLGQELFKLDEKASRMDESTSKKFRSFAQEKKGRVRPREGLFEKLNNYYKEQKDIYASAAKEARKKYLDENYQAQLQAQLVQFKDQRERDSLKYVLYNKELQTNLIEAYRQVGKPLNPVPPNTSRISWRITRSGWKNLDQYVAVSVSSRTTLDYTDPQTGKKAVIRFDTLTINITQPETFDALRVYLIPKGYNSFIRLTAKNNSFTYNLNELLKYDLVIVGYQGENAFSYIQNNITPGTINTTLQTISAVDLETLFSSISQENKVSEFNNQLEYLQSSLKEIKRSKAFAIKEELRSYIRPYALTLCDYR